MRKKINFQLKSQQVYVKKFYFCFYFIIVLVGKFAKPYQDKQIEVLFFSKLFNFIATKNFLIYLFPLLNIFIFELILFLVE